MRDVLSVEEISSLKEGREVKGIIGEKQLES